MPFILQINALIKTDELCSIDLKEYSSGISRRSRSLKKPLTLPSISKTFDFGIIELNIIFGRKFTHIRDYRGFEWSIWECLSCALDSMWSPLKWRVKTCPYFKQNQLSILGQYSCSKSWIAIVQKQFFGFAELKNWTHFK